MRLVAFLALLTGCSHTRLEHVAPETFEARARGASGATPGLSVAAAHVNGERYGWSFGVRSASQKHTVDAGTPFLWFSVTKLFTSAAMLHLAEAEEIDLDSPVADHLPWFQPRPAPARPVTIRHLLNHTSGLANPLPLRWIHAADEPGPTLEPWTRELFEEHPRLSCTPGEKYAYSNLGYLLIGVLIQKVSGVPFETYVERHLLTPLGMQLTGFRHTPLTAAGHTSRFSAIGLAEPFLVQKWARGEVTNGYAELKPFLVDGAPYGGLAGTADDLLSFGLAFLGDARYPLLSKAARAAALEEQRNSAGKPIRMGLGWHLDEADGVPYAYHVGGGAGYKAELRIYPTLGYAVAVVANETSFSTDEITSLILQP